MTNQQDTSVQNQSAFLRLIGKIPVLIGAPIVGFFAMSLGVFAWQILGRTNVLTTPAVPWSTPATMIVLWFYFQYLNGRGWPVATSAIRKSNLRANAVNPNLLPLVIAASLLGLVFTLSLHFLSLRIVELPPEALTFRPQGLDLPWWTLWISVIMASVVAGVCEEAGIRGYLQTPIERKYGAIVAVLISAAVFSAMHFNRELGIALALPIFISALWYGALTSVANSILPMIFIHIALDVFLISYHDLLKGPIPLHISQTGIDDAFIANAFTSAILAILLIFMIRRITKKAATLQS